MKGLRSTLLVWILLAFVCSVSAGENPLTPDLQRALTHAKSVYLVSGHVRFPKTKAFIKTEWVDSTPFEEPLHKEFGKCCRFTVVSDPKTADLIIRAYMTGNTQSVPVFTPGVTGSVTVGSTFIVLDVVDPSSRKVLWSATKNSSRSWSTNTAVSGLVKNFRKLLEEQDKTQVAEIAPSPLASSTSGTNEPTTCISFDKANSQSVPPQLYRTIGQCIQNDDYSNSLALFVLAGIDTRFDASRVADTTASDTGAVLIRNTFEAIPAAAKKKFGAAINAAFSDKSVKDYLCGWVQEVGPPSYQPTYMLMHGMNAVTAGLTKTSLPEELLPVPDPSGRWKAIATSYLHCAAAENGAFRQDAQAAQRYREAIERAIANASASTATGMGESISSPSSATNGNLTRSDQQGPVYGPLAYNREGSDFYIAQNGKFAPASVFDGAIEIHLHPSSFQIGYNGEQMNVCLAQSPFPEIRADPSGYKASCLSGPLTGAREPHSDAVLVYGGHKWSDGNTELSDATSMKAIPMEGFRSAYQVNRLQFVEARDMNLSHFKGTLYGYIVVHKQQHERSNKDIMPIRLIFE